MPDPSAPTIGVDQELRAVEIRPAVAGDADAIAALTGAVQALHAGALPRVFKPAGPDTFPAETVRELMARPDRVFLVAADGVAVLGYAYAEMQGTPESPFRYATARLYVHQMAVPSCAFCRIAAGTAPAHVVWADAGHVAFLDRAPITAGHVVLIPRRHVPTVADLDPEAYAELFDRARVLAGPVAAAAGAPRVGLAVEGFGVDHAHLHLVPVWRGGDLDPCRQAPAAEADLRAAAAQVVAAVAASHAVPHAATARMGPRVLPPQPELRTACLCLTPFHAADAPAVYAYASDPDVSRYVTWPPHQSVAEAAAFVRSAVGQPDTHVWAVRDAPARAAGAGEGALSSAPAVGAVEFSRDASHRGSVHYVLARPYWGRGLATEAVRAVLAWAFAAVPDLLEVRTTAAEANAASRRVLEKLGFRPAGVEVARWAKSPEPVTLCVYALARDAWRNAPSEA